MLPSKDKSEAAREGGHKDKLESGWTAALRNGASKCVLIIAQPAVSDKVAGRRTALARSAKAAL